MLTLLFSTTGGPVARFIQLFTWSDFSHVDAVLPDGSLLGARAQGGVRIRTATYLGTAKTARFHVALSEAQTAAVWTFLRAQIGKPYDFTAILGLLARRDWQNEDKWFCSELIAAACAAAGSPLVRELQDRITPRDLLISPRILPDETDGAAVALKECADA